MIFLGTKGRLTRSSFLLSGSTKSRLLCKGRWADYDNKEDRGNHLTNKGPVHKQSKQSKSSNGNQVHLRAQIDRQVHSDKAGLRSIWEVSLQVWVRVWTKKRYIARHRHGCNTIETNSDEGQGQKDQLKKKNKNQHKKTPKQRRGSHHRGFFQLFLHKNLSASELALSVAAKFTGAGVYLKPWQQSPL